MSKPKFSVEEGSTRIIRKFFWWPTVLHNSVWFMKHGNMVYRINIDTLDWELITVLKDRELAYLDIDINIEYIKAISKVGYSVNELTQAFLNLGKI